jgi:hypothetical protein
MDGWMAGWVAGWIHWIMKVSAGSRERVEVSLAKLPHGTV